MSKSPSPKAERSSFTPSKGFFGFFKFGRSKPSPDLKEKELDSSVENEMQQKLMAFANEQVSKPKKLRKSSRSSNPEAAKKSMNDLLQGYQARPFDLCTSELAPKGFVKQGNDQLVKMNDNKAALVVKNKNTMAHVAAGTPMELFQLLITNDVQEPHYQDCFLLTYRTFMKPAALLLNIIQTYKSISSTDEGDARIKPLLIFVEDWISHHWYDFAGNQALIAAFEKFVEVLETSDHHGVHGDRIRQALLRQVSCIQIMRQIHVHLFFSTQSHRQSRAHPLF